MKWRKSLQLVLPTLVALLVLTGGIGLAQDPDWTKVPRNPKKQQPQRQEVVVRQSNAVATKYISVEFGHPRVLSPRISFPVGQRQRVGGAITLLPDLTAWGVDYRYSLNLPRVERLQYFAGTGLTIYSISDDDRSATPVGLNLSVGALYRTASRFAIGGSIGFLQTTGTEGSRSIKAYGVHKGLSTGYVNFSLGYFF